MHLRLHLKVAFDGALERRAEGGPKSVLRDLYRDVPEVELKGSLLN